MGAARGDAMDVDGRYSSTGGQPTGLRERAPGTPADRRRSALTSAVLAGLSLVSFSLVIGYGRSVSDSAAWTTAMVAGAAALSGGLLGILFGIPRSAQGESDPVPRPMPDEEGRRSPAYGPNTNLEQISDWLTKILVGVTLVQLGNIASGTGRLVDFLASGMAGTPQDRVFILAELVFFSVWGFMLGYFFARLFLIGLFRVADTAGLSRQIEEVRSNLRQIEQVTGDVQQKVTEGFRQDEADARASALTTEQLEAKDAEGNVRLDRLEEAIARASEATRWDIFLRAVALRRETWNSDKRKMERTIPVFQALTRTEIEGRYHRVHGQLGYALKDASSPNLLSAVRELTSAIQLRDAEGQKGYRFYEMARAECRIRLDPNGRGGSPSSSAEQNAIMADLLIANGSATAAPVIARDPIFRGWLSQNGLSLNAQPR